MNTPIQPIQHRFHHYPQMEVPVLPKERGALGGFSVTPSHSPLLGAHETAKALMIQYFSVSSDPADYPIARRSMVRLRRNVKGKFSQWGDVDEAEPEGAPSKDAPRRTTVSIAKSFRNRELSHQNIGRL